MQKKAKIIDLNSIKKTFEELKNNKGKLGISLIDEAMFLNNTLTELKEKINESGVVTEMCQGNYSIDRENPALRSYNTCIKNYQNLIKQILEILPSEKNCADDFDSFGDD